MSLPQKEFFIKVPYIGQQHGKMITLFNLSIKGYIYFNEANFDYEYPLDCISFDIDSIFIQGGLEDIKEVILFYEDGGWEGSYIEKYVLGEGARLFEREIKELSFQHKIDN